MKTESKVVKLLIPEGKIRDAMELYPGKSREEVRRIVFLGLVKRLIPGSAAALMFLILALAFGKKQASEPGILRPEPGKGNVLAQVRVELGDEWKVLPVEVGALEYEEKRIEELHAQAIQYLKTVLPGENKSLEQVTTDLFFPELFPETGGDIRWISDAPWLITTEGEVLNAELQDAETTQITAEISYGSEVRCFSTVVTVYPAVYTGEEAVLKAVREELSAKETAGRTKERFYVPESVQGYRTEQVTEENYSAAGFFVLLAITVPLLLYSGYFGGIDTRRKERKELVESGYSEFITKLSLLMAAGISVRQAFGRLAEEYEKNYGAKHVLARELKVTRQELDNGNSEAVVYEALGRRLGTLAYRRMASLLTQNASKGVQGMRMLLLQEARDVMAQDRAGIRQKGEQAGTRLLLPMMGLLVLVFAILLVPAFQSF